MTDDSNVNVKVRPSSGDPDEYVCLSGANTGGVRGDHISDLAKMKLNALLRVLFQ